MNELDDIAKELVEMRSVMLSHDVSEIVKAINGIGGVFYVSCLVLSRRIVWESLMNA